ncbi:hypothetical protein M422DRAFT_271828 [Sphaerobolus stellatus SS14]|uniref:Uncharacterized protein n=1 Tax=Sphaerobolus stellatus (strain SS14) TaxID=990650 RepID=A0A0C9UP01_SPHS4|nr:hypothetical protein M422DRAFT_271828 [Sphaerobolus stellatus SS14]
MLIDHGSLTVEVALLLLQKLFYPHSSKLLILHNALQSDFSPIRTIFAGIPAPLPPATPITLKRSNQCEKALDSFDLTEAISDQDNAVRIINLALNGGATKGKIKIYNISTIPKQHLEADGGLTNSGITQLGERVKSCQINGRFPKIWGERALGNITNGLRIPQVFISSYLDGINFSTRSASSKSTGNDDFPVRRAIPFLAYDGRTQPFSLTKLASLPTLSEELEFQDIVLVTFTVGSYDWEESEREARQNLTLKSPRKMREEGYKKALGFNIQDIVLLYRDEQVEDVSEGDDDGSADEEQVF